MTDAFNSVLSVELQVDVDDEDIPDLAQLTQWANTGFRQAQSSSVDCAQVSVKVVDSETMQSLNQSYRQQNKVTNVLSFPLDVEVDDDSRLLGDIVICAEKVAAEAAEQQKTLTAHWAHLVIHGVLHLLGFDHEHENEAADMEAKEIAALAELGFDNPYA